MGGCYERWILLVASITFGLTTGDLQRVSHTSRANTLKCYGKWFARHVMGATHLTRTAMAGVDIYIQPFRLSLLKCHGLNQ